MTTTSKRIYYFDNARFILVFFMVLGHVISPLKGSNNVLFTAYAVIFLFHMPSFIFISGYFSKGFNKKGYLIKACKKILLPYLTFQILYSFFYYCNGEDVNLNLNLFQPRWTLWFLLSLFCWNLLLFIFSRFKWVGLIAATMIGMCIGYFDHVGSFLSLSRTFVFFPYFLLGHLIKPEQIKLIKKVKFPLLIGSAILLSSFWLFATYFQKDAIHWLLGDTSYADMGVKTFTSGLTRGGQYLLTCTVLFGFLVMVPSSAFKLTFIGQRTLNIYLFHGFIIKIFETLVPDNTLQRFSNHYILLIIFSISICLVLGSCLFKKWTCLLVNFRFQHKESEPG